MAAVIGDAGPAELLLERDREVESLRFALAETVNGGGRLALVEGPAGIGKSRLLAELRSAARTHWDPKGLFLANHEI